jgi:hypothetical protein
MEERDGITNEIRMESSPVRTGVMVYDNIFVGPQNRNEDQVLKVAWANPVFSVPRPRVVQLHPRQSDNLNYGFPDQFALMLIETDVDYIMFRIRRLDNGAQPTGWGQNLMVDMLVIDDGTQPAYGGG